MNYETQALTQRLKPTAPKPKPVDPFSRGGQVSATPRVNTAALGNLGAASGADIAGRVLGTTAAGAAAGAGISLGTSALANKMRVKEDRATLGQNDEWADLVGGYGRRQEGTGGGAASEAVRYAGYGANPGLVAATGGLSVPVAALGGAIKAWATKNAPSAYTDFRVEDAAEAIRGAYQKYLGREASNDEVQGRLVGQGWNPTGGDRWVGEKNLFSQLGFIRDSEEARQYAARQVSGAGTAGDDATPEASGPASDPTSPFYTGSTRTASQEAPATTTGLSPATAALAGRLSPNGAGLTTGALPADARPSAPDPSGRDPFNGGGVVNPNAPKIDPATGEYSTPAPAVTDTETGETAPVGGAGAAGTPPNPEWNTDGYAAPGYVPPQAGPVPAGWDAGKWNDPNHQTPKYGVGRILSNFPPTVEGLTAAMADIERAYPGTTFNGKDRINIPGVGEVDVLEGASKGGVRWRWGVNDGAGAPQSGQREATAGPALLSGLGEGGNQDDVAAIIAQLLGREGQTSAGGLTKALLDRMLATA